MTAVDGRSETVGLARSIDQIRDAFPGLSDGRAALDGAAGTQLPAAVIDAMLAAMRDAMANVHGAFPGSERSTETVAQARLAVADLLGGTADGVLLGPNMTTLTFMLADTLSRDWGPGDEIVVTSLDHDANIRPWVLAAQRAGATVRWAELDVDTGELPVQARRPRDRGPRPSGRRADLRRRRPRHSAWPDRHRRARRRLLRVLQLQVVRSPRGRGDRRPDAAGQPRAAQARAVTRSGAGTVRTWDGVV